MPAGCALNAHQRRCESRRRHMELPLGKAVDFNALQGRRVYAYGSLSCDMTIYAHTLDKIGSATVHRHVRPSKGGPVDLLLTGRDGAKQVISTSVRGLRLVNREDRAARPWWADTRRKAKAGAA